MTCAHLIHSLWMNIQRRHLTASQRATIAANSLALFEAEAKERQREHGGTAPGKPKSVVERIPQVIEPDEPAPKARDRAADAFGVNPRYVQDAKAINLRRRHLTEGQRALAMANLCKLARGSNQFKPVVIDGQDRETSPTISKAEAAEKAGVDPKTMYSAMKVDRHGSPDLVEAVKAGRVSVSAAAKVVDGPTLDHLWMGRCAGIAPGRP